MKRETLRAKWISAAVDFLTSAAAITVFNAVRYHFNMAHGLQAELSMRSFMTSRVVITELWVFPLMMLTFYWLSGFYASVPVGSRLKDFTNAAGNAIAGSLVFFFVAMLNDTIPMRRWNYELVVVLWMTLTLLVTVGRWTLSALRGRDRKGRPTIIIGQPSRAEALRDKLCRSAKVMGLDVTESVALTDEGSRRVAQAVENGAVEVIAIAADVSEPGVAELIGRFLPYDVSVMIWPGSNIPSLTRRSFDNVAGEPLVDVSRPPMDALTINVKRVLDVTLSSLALIVVSPLLAAIAIAVKADSEGPVFYRQRRVGYHRRPFDIIKFRSMVTDAENLSGPALSSPDDPRVTRVGRFLRKYRLDELPNFWNVIRGDMSLVGPRPEREHFLKRIMERAPQSALLHRVRPGITSWGMVKYGYAQSVDEMVERLRYDLIYVENVSLKVDIKILFYTVNTVITGKGI